MIQIEPHTLLRAQKRGVIENEIRDTINKFQYRQNKEDWANRWSSHLKLSIITFFTTKRK